MNIPDQTRPEIKEKKKKKKPLIPKTRRKRNKAWTGLLFIPFFVILGWCSHLYLKPESFTQNLITWLLIMCLMVGGLWVALSVYGRMKK